METTSNNETLILGLGNTILTDDSVGIKILERIIRLLPVNSNIDTCGASVSGLALLDIISGYKKLILIDSIITNKDKIGTLRELKLSEFDNSIHHDCAHQLNFPTVIDLAKKTGIPIPDDIKIFTIEVRDIRTLSEDCSPELESKIPVLAGEIMKRSRLAFAPVASQ